jgi:hypothetical protein
MTQLSLDCRTRLYRAVWVKRDGSNVHAFLLANSAVLARDLFCHMIALLAGEPADVLALYNVTSYRDLAAQGLHEDVDWRVFETDWRGGTITDWVTHPLFLTDDPTLVHAWVELQAELAEQTAREAMGRVGIGGGCQ